MRPSFPILPLDVVVGLLLGAAFGGGLPLAGEAVRGEGGLGGGATVVFRGFHNG